MGEAAAGFGKWLCREGPESPLSTGQWDTRPPPPPWGSGRRSFREMASVVWGKRILQIFVTSRWLIALGCFRWSQQKLQNNS